MYRNRLGGGRRQSDDHHRTVFACSGISLANGGWRGDGFKGIVHTFTPGQVFRYGHGILSFGVDCVRGPKLFGFLQLKVVDIYSDDHTSTGQGGPLHRVHADTTTANNHDTTTRSHLCPATNSP